MVPRYRARLRRPGREEGEALRSRGLFCRLMSWERFGGGVGMKVEEEPGEMGESRGAWVPYLASTALPERYLRPLALLGPMDLRVATAAAKPTRQHKEVVPSLTVSSQLETSAFRYLSTKYRHKTRNHRTEATASIRLNLTGPPRQTPVIQVSRPMETTAI